MVENGGVLNPVMEKTWLTLMINAGKIFSHEQSRRILMHKQPMSLSDIIIPIAIGQDHHDNWRYNNSDLHEAVYKMSVK